MSDAPKRRRRHWLYPTTALAIVASGAAIGFGPAAPWVVDRMTEGVRVWRLGHLGVVGVHGAWLGGRRGERVAIADEHGVWLEAENATLSWRPQDMLFGAIRIDNVSAGAVTILRQPDLLPDRPPRGLDFDVRLDRAHIGALHVAESAVGAAGDFTADFSMRLRDDELHALDLSLQRTDSQADHAFAHIRGGDAFALNVDIAGAPNGIIARALGAGAQGFRATARGDGDITTGSARFEALVGTETLLNGAGRWSAAQWASQVEARFDLLPGLRAMAQRIGDRLSITASGARVGAFALHADTPYLAVDLTGANDERNALAGPAHFVASTRQLSRIAHEQPFDLGPARLEGELRSARGVTAIQATLEAANIDALGRRVRLVGPVRAALSRERFHLVGDLAAPDGSPALFAHARLQTELSFDRERERFELTRASLSGDAVAIDAHGWANHGDGEFSGQWRARLLGAIFPGLDGEAGGRWRAFAEPHGQARVWTTTVEGEGARIAGSPNVVPQLLGPAPRLDARFAYENGGLTVAHARVDGAQLRAGATGRIVRGEADLALEASARGPLTLGEAEIAGAVDATGRLTGRIARPTLAMSANLTSFAAGGVVVVHPVVNFTLAPAGRGYAGHASAEGAASGQPLTVSSDVAVRNGALILTGLDGQWGALAAQGEATFASRGVSANLDVNGALDGLAPGAGGRVAGRLALTPGALRLDAQIADARAGELRVRAATLHAEGPFEAIAARFDMRGRLRQAPLKFAGTGALALGRGATSLAVEGRGILAEADVFTRAPIRAVWRDGASEASINVALGDGVVETQWRERGRALTGSARIIDAPLAPLAAIWGERASGRIDGRMNIANTGAGLSGSGDITLNDARFAGRQRGTLDMHIVGDLDPGRLTAVVDATSTDGLVAHLEADAPVVTSAAPIRVALAPQRRGRATWTVRGPAGSLWAATRLQDQSLQGQLDGQGELSFGAGSLSGAGHIEIVDGRFEDKVTGVTLADIDARLDIDERGHTIEHITAVGPHGGHLTAAGGSANPRQGRIEVDVDDMRVADRPDARARASGQLILIWDGLNSTLSGGLNIDQADLDIAGNPEAGIPTLEVIEVNRPGEEYEPDETPEAPQRVGATALDVRIRAPGRVFTRGRGMEAEWSLDLRLRGTSADPQLFGEARAIRGTLALSGQPFDIEDARIVFGGDPLDAEIDLSAVRDTADLTARIRLTGTARDPEIAFSSDPPLPEDEILPQILFGRSVEDLSALEAAQLAASLAALSGRASLNIVDAARAAAGLDRFNVRQDENGGFLVAGGIYLTRGVYVEVARTGLGQAQTRVEWTIRPRLVLVTSFLGNGDQRVSLRWRRESD
jgi:translocation and assembly module TamB